MTVSDQELLERIAGGDREALGELFDRHSARLLSLLVSIVGCRSDAEDVLHNTFLQIWRLAGIYDAARAQPLVWMLVLARSRALDWLRSRTRSAEASTRPDNRQAAPTPPPDPSEQLLAKEAAERVRRALGQLPEDQATPVRLAFFEGRTHEQIADALRTPLGTVKTRIRTGIRRLRRMLADEAEESS